MVNLGTEAYLRMIDIKLGKIVRLLEERGEQPDRNVEIDIRPPPGVIEGRDNRIRGAYEDQDAEA